jgi:UDP-galactopyranose mutase
MKRALVIGGGFAGCAAAHQLSLLGGWDIDLVERAPFLGGGVKTHWRGGHPFTFGPRHFLTPSEDLFSYLNAIVPMRKLDHEFITYIEKDRNFYTFPIHEDDLPRMPERDTIYKEIAEAQEIRGWNNARNFEEYWRASVGDTLYRKMVDGYSRKMWQVESNTQIDDFGWSPKGVAIKSGPREGWDTVISAYPLAADGYDRYFQVATAEVNVKTGTEIERFDIPNKRVQIAGGWHQYDLIVSTIAPDTLMNNVFGELPFVGRDFITIILPVEFAFPDKTYFTYYAGDEPYTRIVEYKKFTQHKAPSTLLGIEIPSFNNRLYPLPIKKHIARAYQYFDAMPEGVVSMGRAGSYKYIDIDDLILQAMTFAKELEGGGLSHPVPIYGADQTAPNLLTKTMVDEGIVPGGSGPG